MVHLEWNGKKKIDFSSNSQSNLKIKEVYDLLDKFDGNTQLDFNSLNLNWKNLLFSGDNKEIMLILLNNGYYGKINLIYIDPPFNSGSKYSRKIKLKGNFSVMFEQDILTYEDIWNLDDYLQFMYERLLILKELLSEDGSIFVHIDMSVSHYIKLIMDEIFGSENFLSEIVWYRYNKIPDKTKKMFFKVHDTIFHYAKNKGKHYFNSLTKPTGEIIRRKKMKKENGKIKTLNEFVEYEKELLLTKSVIDFVPDINIGNSNEKLHFQTQKPEKLLELIIQSSSKEDDLILDCFSGSGTTIQVSQKLNRRWIGIDLNQQSIQLTSLRVQKIINNSNTKYPVFFNITTLNESKNLNINQDISISKKDSQINIKLNDYYSNSFRKYQDINFKHLIEGILIDNNYDGKFFKVKYIDIPEKTNTIKGEYIFKNSGQKFAIKILNILGEEYLKILQ